MILKFEEMEKIGKYYTKEYGEEMVYACTKHNGFTEKVPENTVYFYVRPKKSFKPVVFGMYVEEDGKAKIQTIQYCKTGIAM